MLSFRFAIETIRYRSFIIEELVLSLTSLIRIQPFASIRIWIQPFQNYDQSIIVWFCRYMYQQWPQHFLLEVRRKYKYVFKYVDIIVNFLWENLYLETSLQYQNLEYSCVHCCVPIHYSDMLDSTYWNFNRAGERFCLYWFKKTILKILQFLLKPDDSGGKPARFINIPKREPKFHNVKTGFE